MTHAGSGAAGARVTDAVLGRGALALPALAAGWLLAGLPLLLLGAYRPLPAVLLGGPAALAAAWLVLRRRPALARPALVGPAWAGWLSTAVVAGFLILSWGWSSEHIVLRRDSGAYALYADWLVTAGTLPIPVDAGVFGPGVTFSSAAFYGDGGSVVPQFLPGTPMLLAVGGWLGGLPGILHANAVLGAASLLAVMGLAARLAGPRVAPFVGIAVGLAYPVLHAARSPYSEPLAALLLFGGLALLAERRLPFVGGLLAGLATLARIDAPADLLLLAPYAVFAAPLLGAGAAAGVAAGLLSGVVLSRPYVDSLAPQLTMIGVAGALLAAAAVVLRRRRLPSWLPVAAGAAVVAAAVGFAVRPLFQQVRRTTTAEGLIGTLQRQQGLPLDPTRTYDERSLHWVAWWLGWPAVVLGVAGLALLVHGRLRSAAGSAGGGGSGGEPSDGGSAPVPDSGGAPRAGGSALFRASGGEPRAGDPAPFVLVLAAAALVVLWQPSITPDHPWADRRLVPVLLPGLVLCAGWLLSRWPRPLAFAGGVAVLLPIGLATQPLLGAATERGQVRAVERVCAGLGPRAAVVVTGAQGSNELPQLLRGRCKLPVAVLTEDRLAGALPGVASAVRRAGRQLTVVAMAPEPLTRAGLRAVRLVDLRTLEDAKMLVERPERTAPLRVEVWAAVVG